MVASLNYLLNENHYESKVVFTPFKYKVQNIISILEKSEFKEELKKGKSFVQSRADALDFIIPGTASHLKGSNNTLALSYLLRIKRTDSIVQKGESGIGMDTVIF